MTVSYKGSNKVDDKRLAEISFYDDEEKLLDRIITLMNIKGWTHFSVFDNYACHEVDNLEEYRSFRSDWKVSKKCIKDCMRFGF